MRILANKRKKKQKYPGVYKDDKGHYYIVVRNRKDGKHTTIRKNPRTDNHFLTPEEAFEFKTEYLNDKVDLFMTFDDLIQRYFESRKVAGKGANVEKEKSWYEQNIKPAIGDRIVISLRANDMEKVIFETKKHSEDIRYINKMLGNIKTVIRYGITQGYLETSSVLNYESLKEIHACEDLKFWTIDEIQILLDAIPKRYKKNQDFIHDAILFGYLMGFRSSEIRAMQWTQIDFKRNIIRVDYHINCENKRVKGRKNGSGYTVVMDDMTKKLLEEIYEKRKSVYGFKKTTYVFPSLRNGLDHYLGENTMSRWMINLTEYTGLENATFHGLRHSIVCAWASVFNLTPYEIADRIGDTVKVVLEFYYDFFTEQKQVAANKINSQNKAFAGIFPKLGEDNETDQD